MMIETCNLVTMILRYIARELITIFLIFAFFPKWRPYLCRKVVKLGVFTAFFYVLNFIKFSTFSRIEKYTSFYTMIVSSLKPTTSPRSCLMYYWRFSTALAFQLM